MAKPVGRHLAVAAKAMATAMLMEPVDKAPAVMVIATTQHWSRCGGRARGGGGGMAQPLGSADGRDDVSRGGSRRGSRRASVEEHVADAAADGLEAAFGGG